MKCKLVNKDIRDNYTNELLMERGLTQKELDYFLNVPDDSYLQSPHNFDNIEAGATMFDDMVVNLGEQDRIIVVADSDVDGFTSAAIFIQYLQKHNIKVQIEYILHEGKGHGLADTFKVILNKHDELPNIKYVILPDAGSNDYEYIEQLGELGIHCLILDHHIVEPDTKFSDYAVIINNQLSPNYTNKDLQCRETFKLVKCFINRKGE